MPSHLHHMLGGVRPRHIVPVITIKYTKHCLLQLGKYLQVHESHDNMMQERATGDIALRPTGNAQGAYFFIRFTTGWRLNSQLFIPHCIELLFMKLFLFQLISVSI